MKVITQNFSLSIIWYPVIIVLSILVGAGLSYIVNITRMLGIYKAHDMGLGNLFLMVALLFLTGQILSLILFFHTKILLIIIILIIINVITIIKLIW